MGRKRWCGGVGVAFVAAVVSAGAGASEGTGTTAADASASVMHASITPKVGERHQRFVVALPRPRATGVVGRTQRSLVVAAQATHGASGCVNNRDRTMPDGPAGTRGRATLDPARGEGGPEGWCRGPYAGTVTEATGFACPRRGRCRPPAGFPSRSRVVARFTFRVR